MIGLFTSRGRPFKVSIVFPHISTPFSVTSLLIPATGAAEFDAGLERENQSEARKKHHTRRLALYLGSILPMIPGAGWTRFFHGQMKFKLH